MSQTFTLWTRVSSERPAQPGHARLPGWGHSPEIPAPADSLAAASQDRHRRHDVIVLVFTELVHDEALILLQLPQLHCTWGMQGNTHL